MAGYVDLPEGFEIVSYGDTPKPNISDDLPEGFEIVSYGEQPATKPAVNQAAPKQPTTNINNPTPQPTKTLTGGVSVNVTNPNKSQSTWRNAGRQFARGTARALAPEKLENWAVGSKNDEALLNQYIQSGVPTYEQIDKDYRAGKIDKAQLKVLVNKRKNFDDLMADAEYRAVRNKNIGKGTLEVGTAAIGGGAGTAAAKVGAQAIKQGSKQLAKQALKEVGKTSAIGAGYGASEGVIDENINPVTNALKQAAIWGTTHAATLGAGKGIQAAANTKAGKAVGKAVSDAKAKVDDKVFDAITSTEAGVKALQKLEDVKNAVGKELIKERTFKQARQAKQNKISNVEVKNKNLNYSHIDEGIGADGGNYNIVRATDNNGNIIGEINYIYFPESNRVHISDQSVIPTQKRKGIATDLIEVVKKQTGTNQIDGNVLTTEGENFLNGIEKKGIIKRYFKNTDDVAPSQYGVAEDNSAINQQLADRMNNDVIAEQELLNEYNQKVATAKEQYGSVENLKAQAVKDMEKEQWGEVTQPLKDYRELVEYEKTLGQARYVNPNSKSVVNGEYSGNVANAVSGKKTFRQAKAERVNKRKQEPFNPSMLEEAGSPVKSKTGINTQETNLPHVKEAPVSSKVIDNAEIPQGTPIPQRKVNSEGNELRERGSIKNLEQLGIDTSELPSHITEYERKTYNQTKRQLDALTPQQKAQLVNDVNSASDVANLAKSEAIKESLERGEVPDELIENWVKAGTEEARTLQARQYLVETPEGGIVAIKKGLMAASPEATALKDETAKLIEAFTNGDSKAVNEIIRQAGLSNGRKNKNFIKALDDLANKGNLNEKNVKDLIDDKFGVGKVTVEDYQHLKKMYEQLKNTTPNTRAYEKQLALINKYIAKKIPTEIAQMAKTGRNIMWLLNPKTAERNLLGNSSFAALEKAIVEPLAVPIDMALSLKSGYRSRVLPQLKDYFTGLKRGFKQGVEDVRLGINTRDKVKLGSRHDLQQQTFKESSISDFKNVWKNTENKAEALAKEVQMVGENFGNSIEKLLAYELQVPDRTFFEGAYRESLVNQMRAAKATRPTQEMREIATEEALESVFQNNSSLASSMADLRRGLNRFNVKGVGVGDLTIPYVQTPANIGMQRINYSPIGFARAIDKYKKGGSQRDFSKALARAIVGTTGGTALIAGIGATGAKIIKEVDNYGKQYKNDIAMGKQYNSIQLPDGTYVNFEGLDPITGHIKNAIAFNEAADIVKNAEGLDKLTAAYPLAKTAIEPVMDMMDDAIGLGTAAKLGPKEAADYIASKAIRSASGGLMKSLGNATDKYVRETKDKSKTKTAINEVVASVPGLRKSLPVKYDVTGKAVETKGAVQEMFNPVKVTKKTDDATLNTMEELAEITKDTAFLLPEASNKIDIKISKDIKKRKELTTKEYSRYQQLLGSMAKEHRDNKLSGPLNINKTKNNLKTTDSDIKQYIYYREFGGMKPDISKKRLKVVEQLYNNAINK